MKLHDVMKRFMALLLTFALMVGMVGTEALAYVPVASDDISNSESAEDDVPEHEHNEDGWKCTRADDTRELTCTLEEHIHTDECYAPVEKEAEPICGLEESEGHTHTDACYEEVITYNCGLEESEGHHHTDECYDGAEPTCGLEEAEGHTHTDDCYTTEKTLACGQEESEGHTHTDACYTEETVLSCGQEESEGHTHNDECYAELTCGLEDSDGHTHGETCTVIEKKLVCGLEASEGHKHTEECYPDAPELICEKEETLGHTHGDSCYIQKLVLVCEEDHDHDANCYELQKELACDKKEEEAHKHTAECYKDGVMPDRGELICGKKEHSHTAECYTVTEGGWTCVAPVEESEETEEPQGNAGIMRIGAGTLEVNGESKTPGTVTVTGGTVKVSGTWKGNIIVKSAGEVTFTGGGTIDATGYDGSAIWVQSGTVIINGVTITGGIGTMIGKPLDEPDKKVGSGLESRGDGTFRAGGGIFVQRGTLKLVDGTITANTAQRGGGIFINNGADLEMTGGTVSENKTVHSDGTIITGNGNYAGEGGGIFVYGTAHIKGGQIIDNECNSTTDLGGGGLYINNNGVAELINAVVTNNTADGFGGGIAGCCHGEASLVATDGVALYGNTAYGTNGARVYAKTKDAEQNATDLYDQAKKALIDGSAASDFYNAGSTVVSAYMAGGGSERYEYIGAKYKMEKNEKGNLVPNGEIETPESGILKEEQTKIFEESVVALKANPTQDDIDLKPTQGVLISGNKSTVHGGGIGCNGILFFGSNATQTVESNVYEFTIEGTKAYEGLQEDQFEFGLYSSENCVVGKELAKAKNKADGSISLSYTNYLKEENDKLVTSYVFYVKEIDGNEPNISYDRSVYKVEVNLGYKDDITVTKDIPHLGSNSELGQSNIVKVNTVTHRYYASQIRITKIADRNGKTINEEVPSGRLAFENYSNGSLTISKEVICNEAQSEKPDISVFHVIVTFGTGGKVISIGPGDNEVIFDASNRNITYNIAIQDDQSVTIKNIPIGTAYTISEADLDENWKSDISSKKGAIGNAGSTSTVSVTNTYFKTKKTELTVVKTWDLSNSGEYTVPYPQKINVQLFRDGKEYGDEIQLTAGNEWTYSWNNIPMYKAENEPYSYTVKEMSVTYGFSDYTPEENLIVVYGDHYVKDDPKQKEILGGWIVSNGDPISTTADSEQNRKFTITNEWVPADNFGVGSFTLLKVDEKTREPIEGVKFNLRGPSYPDGKDFWTDEEGKISFEKLKDGDYVLSEVEAAEGWRNGKNEECNSWYTFSVEYDKMDLIAVHGSAEEGYNWKNEWQGDLTGDVKEPVFTLTNRINRFNIELNKIVDLDGENGNDREYLKDVEFSFLVTGTGVNGEEYEYTYELNQANNWHVTVQDLPYGTYRIVENGRVPVPYYDYVETTFDGSENVKDVTTGPFSYEFTCNDDYHGAVVTVTATNHYTLRHVGLDIEKQANLDGDVPNENNKYSVEGQFIVFKVDGTDVNGNKYQTAILQVELNADGNGISPHIPNLPVGTYIITEVSNDLKKDFRFSDVKFDISGGTGDAARITKSGTNIEGQPYIEVDLTGESNGALLTVTATNEYEAKTTSLTIHKDISLDGTTYEDSEIAHEYFVFELYGTTINDKPYYSEENPRTIKVVYGDDATFDNVPYGTYWVRESHDVDIKDYDFGEVVIKRDDSVQEQNEDGWVKVQLGGDDVKANLEVKLSVTNEYTRQTGALQLTKKLVGNQTDPNKDWNFTIALFAPTDLANYVKVAGSYDYVLKDGDNVIESGEIKTVRDTVINVTLKGGQSITIDGLPVGTDYIVSEQEYNQDGYATYYSGQTGTIQKGEIGEAALVTVTNAKGITDVRVHKVWDGGPEADSIEVRLLKNDELYDTQELNTENNWTYLWEDLPADGIYSVEEVELPDGYEAEYDVEVSEPDENGATADVTITNHYHFINIDVLKVWDDNGSGRPAYIQVQLYRNGMPEGRPITLSQATGWSYTWTNLDGRDSWRVEEVNVPEQYRTSTRRVGNMFIITNTYVPELTDITVNKVWVGDSAETRPTYIQVQLLRDGSVYGPIVTLTAPNWRYTWEDLDADADWSIRELTSLYGYTATVTVGENTITLVNSYTTPEPTPTPSDEPTPTPTTTPTPTPTPSQEPTPTPSQQPTPTPNNQRDYPEENDTPNNPNGPNVPEDQPNMDLPNDDTPLADAPNNPNVPNNPNAPEEEPGTDLPDTDIPLADMPPQTGETIMNMIWMSLLVASGAGILLTVRNKKREEN